MCCGLLKISSIWRSCDGPSCSLQHEWLTLSVTWNLLHSLTEKSKPLGQSLLGAWQIAKKKKNCLPLITNFEESHWYQNIQRSVMYLWGSITKRFLTVWVMWWKESNAMNSPPVLEKMFARSFLYYLYLFVIGFSLSPFVKVSKSLADGNFFYIKKKLLKWLSELACFVLFQPLGFSNRWVTIYQNYKEIKMI